MHEHRKYAYRYLLYWATLDIRPIAWLRIHWWNPLSWVGSIRRVRRAGAIADWVHNLALFSALEFQGFDDGLFWDEFERLRRIHPEYDLDHYRWVFDRAMSEATVRRNGTNPPPASEESDR